MEMEEVLQLGSTSTKQPLALSASFVRRRRPLYGVDFTAASSSPYVSHILSLQHGASTSLLSYTDDRALRIHDKRTLDTQHTVVWPDGGDCSSFAQVPGGFLAAGRSGQLGFWDIRQPLQSDGRPTSTLAGPSRSPYLSVAASGSIIAAGTELQGSDANIDVWDSRKSTEPIISYHETHSDDITYLAFHPDAQSVLLSASSDGLVAISDTRQANEDDSVVGVVNTGASVARAGWGGSAGKFARIAAVDGDEIAAHAIAQDWSSLGAFYSVSDMQTVGMWEADSFAELLPVRDVRQARILPNSASVAWQTEYVIDASAGSSLLQNSESVAVFCGEQGGGMALVEIPNALEEDAKPWSLHLLATGGHNEVVRSVSWDAGLATLFTGGEDGRLCAWSLNEGGAGAAESHPSEQTISHGIDVLPPTAAAPVDAAIGPTRNSSSKNATALQFAGSAHKSAREGHRNAGRPY